MNRKEKRKQALFCVYQSLLLNQDINISINNQTSDMYTRVDNEMIPLKNDHFFRTITVNVFNNYDYLQQEISNKLVDWKFDRLGYIEQAVLLIGATEIFTEADDRGVIIDEAIQLVKEFGEEDSYKLINGVLDQL